MNNSSVLHQTDVEISPDEGSSEMAASIVSIAGAESGTGVFEAGLHYLAADLQDLAGQAPEHKREALDAIVGLVRALADG